MTTLLVEGATERDLAERFDLSQSTVHRDVVTIEKRWEREANKTIDSWKSRLLAGHEHTIREAHTEWHRSKADAQEIDEVTELVEDPYAAEDTENAVARGEPVRPKIMAVTKRVVTVKGQTGDPRYLTAIINARAEQAKILGAHAPASVHHSGETGGPIPVQIIEMMPPTPRPDADPGTEQ